MSEIKTTIRVDGEEIEAESIRAYEVLGEHVFERANELRELTRIAPERVRDDLAKAIRKLDAAGARARRVADEARREERLGTEDPLAAGIAAADRVEGRKR
jgi:hypothetical protein